MKNTLRIVDLTLPMTNDMPGVHVSAAKRLEIDGWNATTLQLYSHCGTHMDAPCHFLPGGATVDQQDLNVVTGPALVVNLTPVQPRQLHTIDDLKSIAGRVVPGVRLLLRTDWHQRFGTPEYRQELPRISVELAHWLVERRVALVGVEPPSVADVNNKQELTEVHQILFRGGIVIVEGLAHLDKLASNEVDFTALPLKVVGGDGTPVRAIAREYT
jgi:kynurenine formamidase